MRFFSGCSSSQRETAFSFRAKACSASLDSEAGASILSSLKISRSCRVVFMRTAFNWSTSSFAAQLMANTATRPSSETRIIFISVHHRFSSVPLTRAPTHCCVLASGCQSLSVNGLSCEFMFVHCEKSPRHDPLPRLGKTPPRLGKSYPVIDQSRCVYRVSVGGRIGGKIGGSNVQQVLQHSASCTRRQLH